ncbi:MAG: hypothetical protein HPY57_15340 [Ignavibacteria bacterium]|nr:hypothetical protein [Ignavibacteria bacterium]
MLDEENISGINESTLMKVKHLLNKGKTLSKNVWNVVKVEGEETKIAYQILVKLIRSENVFDNEKLFLKKQSVDLVKVLPIIAIQGIPFTVPLTLLLIILGKQIGFDILPKDHRYLLDEELKEKDNQN